MKAIGIGWIAVELQYEGTWRSTASKIDELAASRFGQTPMTSVVSADASTRDWLGRSMHVTQKTSLGLLLSVIAGKDQID
jgi:hypothetical protein